MFLYIYNNYYIARYNILLMTASSVGHEDIFFILDDLWMTKK